MNVLIIGLGYAGTRFLRAFKNEGKLANEPIDFAYVGKHQRRTDLSFFSDVATALGQFKPQIVVVSVNDHFHGEILAQLREYEGFIICEKPLTFPQDDLECLSGHLSRASGFCLDLVERYSEATTALKNYVDGNHLKLVRGHFYWGKDRINDHRPTCGVTSEVIHALDLIQYICNPFEKIKLQGVLGSRSDFSISGSDVLDSIALTATLGSAAVTGYSSFVNITRKREVDSSFQTPHGTLVYATLVFDSPEWDIDSLRIWERTASGEKTVLEFTTQTDLENVETKTVLKLGRLVKDVIGFVRDGSPPAHAFSDIPTTLELQRLLDAIDAEVETIGPVQYVLGQREIFYDVNDLERLG